MNTLIAQLHHLNIITQKNQINKQAQRLLENNSDVKAALFKQTLFLDDDISIRARLYCVINKIQKPPQCQHCEKTTTFNKSKNRFNTFCSHTCSHKSSIPRKRQRQTMLARYGVDNPSQSPAINQRRIQTNIDRYGGNAPAHSTAVQEKIQQSKLLRYGAEQKAITIKRKQTMIKKYGVPTWAQQKTYNATEQLSDPNWMKEQHHTHQKSLTEIAHDLKVSVTTVARYYHQQNIGINYYPHKHNETSKVQQEIIHFLNKHNNNVQENVRSIISPRELDIYVPSHNFAVEVNGTYWHTDLHGNKPRTYHISKSIQCEEHGIKLIQLWNTEWDTKQEIVQSRLLSALGKSTKIYARSCTIKQLDSKTEQIFFTTTHVQGYVPSKVCYGLFDKNNVLVAAMSFIKPRFNKHVQWELLRLSSSLNTQVLGGASKLFSHFIRCHQPNNVISYSDRRWGSGGVYLKLGFRKTHNTTPNYFYINMNGDTSILHSRVKFQKHKLQGVLEQYNPKLSEWENMINHNYDRVWDCGSSVFLWDTMDTYINTP